MANSTRPGLLVGNFARNDAIKKTGIGSNLHGVTTEHIYYLNEHCSKAKKILNK